MLVTTHLEEFDELQLTFPVEFPMEVLDQDHLGGTFANCRAPWQTTELHSPILDSSVLGIPL